MRTKEFDFFTIRELFVNMSKSEQNDFINKHFIDSSLVLLHILDEFRKEVDYPIYLTSTFRDVEHNKRVGGVPTSQHLIGQAIDFTTRDLDKGRLLYDFPDFVKRCAFSEIGQVIVYFEKKFIHLGLRTSSQKNYQIYEKGNH